MSCFKSCRRCRRRFANRGAASFCRPARSPLLQRVSYLVSSRTQLDEALAALTQMPKLNSLELVIKNFIVCPDQMRVVGECCRRQCVLLF